MSKQTVEDFRDIFLNNTPLIDVRAPVEFVLGSLPGSINLPIMNDQERAAVGTTYKQQGREAAIHLGHQLVSGETKAQRVDRWAQFIHAHPEAVIYCFRGGLRSQITQKWLAETGLQRPLIEGGYKAVRNFLINCIDDFASQKNFQVISGPTGSAKTRLMQEVREIRPTVDLEALARHRGSAFGGTDEAQPSQINFENMLAVELLKLTEAKDSKPVLVEDESRLIGRCAIPEKFFERMRASALIYIDEPFAARVENIFEDYILRTPIGARDVQKGLAQFAKYRKSMGQITNKMGGLRTQELLNDLAKSEEEFQNQALSLESNKVWIEKLLKYYYDPMYARSLAKRNPKILFRENWRGVLDFLKS